MPKKSSSPKIENRRVLVTGGAGFIGSHLCERLLADSYEVLCVDNYRTGSPRNLRSLLPQAGFEALNHDIALPLNAEVDAIYNLACAASPLHSVLDPLLTTETTVQGAMNMLGLAKTLAVPIFQASTSKVYGNPEEFPQSEEYCGQVDPVDLRACFDEGKRCAETLFFGYHRRHGLAVRVARIFDTYGPRMAFGDGRAMSSFIEAALRGDPLLIFGDGTQTRTFCHIRDLIDGMVAFMNNGKDFAGPLNLGDAEETSILDLASLIVDITGSKSQVLHSQVPKKDPIRRKPDLRLAREKLDWSPKVGLREGLTETIEYFDALLSAGESLTKPSLTVADP